MTSDTWNLKYPQIETIKVHIPPLSEQNRVADMLGTLERRIAKQAQLVENLKKYKRGVMQRIFRQLPSQNGAEWTCVRLGPLATELHNRGRMRCNHVLAML